MKKYTFICILVCLLACKSTKKAEYIQFGSGGGFTGEINQYQIDRAGNISKFSKESNRFVEINLINNNVSNQIFKNMKQFGLDTLKLNDPHNLYYYINYKSGLDTNYIVWSGKLNPELNSLQSIYSLLISQTKSIKK